MAGVTSPPPVRRPVSRRVRRNRTFAVVLVLLVGFLVFRACTGADPAGSPTPPGASDASAASGSPATTPAASPKTSVATPATAAAPNSEGETGGPIPSDAPSVVAKGTGTFTVLDPPEVANDGAGRRVTYTIEIEGGLDVKPAEFETDVEQTLLDKRGWQSQDGVHFVNVTKAEAAAGARVDIRITLASPETVDKLCAPAQTRGEVSCFNGGRAVINLRRWTLGDDAYGDNRDLYRIYLVNHEVGHGLGHGHVGCPAAGKPAPVMMQQTYQLGGCVPWPYPVPQTSAS